MDLIPPKGQFLTHISLLFECLIRKQRAEEFQRTIVIFKHRDSLKKEIKNKQGFPGGSVVKVRLPLQETWVLFLVEDSTFCGAAKPMRHIC